MSRLGCTVAWVLAVAAVTILPMRGLGQDALPAGGERDLEAPRVDRTHVTLAHEWVRRWVDRGSAEELPGDAAGLPGMLPPEIPVTGCLGVRVTLRKDGITMGTGEVVFDDSAAPLEAMHPMRDLVPLVREATAQALKGVEQSLADAHLKAVVAPARPVQGRQPETPRRLTLEEIGAGLLIDLQVGHQREPIRIGRMEEYHALFRNFAPGHHGLILKAEGELPASWQWPASALATNIAPRSQVVQLLTDQKLRSDDLVAVSRPGGPALDRFKVFHMVQPTANRGARLLVRGAAPLPPINLSRRGVDDVAQAMGRHLERRLGPTGLVAGTYLPTADTYDPANSPDDERALVLYALMRWSNAQPDVAAEGTAMHRLSRRVVQVATELAASYSSPEALPDPAAAALTLLVLVDSKAVTDRKAQRDALAGKLMSMRDANGYFVQKDGDRTRAPNHPTQSIMAAALSAMFEQTRQPELAAAANLNLAALWTTQQQTTQITSLPWLLSAELRLARLGVERGAGDEAAIKAKYTYLGDLVDRLCRRQIVEIPRVGPDDVVGGFDLTSSVPAEMPVADWRSAFVLAFIAEALRSEQIAVPEERDRLGWLLTCGLTARFMFNLTFNETACWYVRSKPDALGGVRLAFWDNRLPAAATAIGLIAMTQFQETLADAAGEGVVIPDSPLPEEDGDQDIAP